MDQVLLHVGDVLSKNHSMIVMVAGFVLVAVAKVWPNSSAGPLMSKLQGGVDMCAKVVAAAGVALKAFSDLLADLIKSDGIMGKK